MPIYEYRCDSCGHEFETIQKVSEDPLQTCPDCEQNALVKKVSAAGFRLKGGGWYETDFKSGNKRNVSGDHSGDHSGDNSGDKKKPAASSSSNSTSSSSGSDSGSGSNKTDKPAASTKKSD